jgi:hypothetical protein
MLFCWNVLEVEVIGASAEQEAAICNFAQLAGPRIGTEMQERMGPKLGVASEVKWYRQDIQ